MCLAKLPARCCMVKAQVSAPPARLSTTCHKLLFTLIIGERFRQLRLPSTCSYVGHLSPQTCVVHRLHLSHCLLSILSKLDDTRPFEELRLAYNSVRAKNASEAPAHGEWTMVGFCNHIFCRWVIGHVFSWFSRSCSFSYDAPS